MIGSEEDSKNNHLDNYETLFFYKEASGVFARYEKELHEKYFIVQIIWSMRKIWRITGLFPLAFLPSLPRPPSRWRKHIIVSEENMGLDEKTSASGKFSGMGSKN
ncbi:hypothetical protein [Legionella fairfieldensis]|uniref:hypothetical protein n=1 Tax=Legionella fairfieldensis TaxID=45064 RepID=UPI00049019B8|nr:hypothetical protein [Legionella fairfieldensis]